MTSIIGVGDNTVDCYLHLGKMFPGGNSVNVPVLAHRYGVEASYLGWLANDTRGNLLKTALEEETINLSHCRMVAGENAYCEVNIEAGERVFGQYSEGVCDQIKLTEDDFAFIGEHSLTHTSLYSFIEPFLPALKEASRKLSFDFTSDWDEEYLAQYAPFVDIAVLSSQADTLDENRAMMAWIASLGPAIVIVTGGEQGALVYDGKNYHTQPIVPAGNVIDTLGAGDAFAARFLVEHLNETPLPQSLNLAAASAAETCGYYGAFGHGMTLPQHEISREKEY